MQNKTIKAKSLLQSHLHYIGPYQNSNLQIYPKSVPLNHPPHILQYVRDMPISRADASITGTKPCETYLCHPYWAKFGLGPVFRGRLGPSVTQPALKCHFATIQLSICSLCFYFQTSLALGTWDGETLVGALHLFSIFVGIFLEIIHQLFQCCSNLSSFPKWNKLEKSM